MRGTSFLRTALTTILALAIAGAGGGTAIGRETDTTLTTYVYVSPNGDDDASGSADAPFRTLEQARTAVRGLISEGMSGDVVVRLHEGTYYRDTPFRLDERDSGRDGHRVVYTRVPGERPVVVGGRPITGWELADGEVYRAAIPAVNGQKWTFNQLFIEDRRATLAREPDSGYVKAESTSRTHLRYREQQTALFEGMADPTSAQIYVWPQRDWFSNTVSISGVDPMTREVTFADDVLHTLQSQRDGSRYFLQGFAEALDRPGEWYLDRDEGYVYYWPRAADGPIEQQTIVAPTVRDVFQLRGTHRQNPVRDIVVKGLDFSVSAFTDYFLEHQEANSGTAEAPRGRVWNRPAERNRHGAIRLENSQGIVLRNLEVRNAGFSGISIDEYSRDATVSGNVIRDVGYHGVIVTGVRAGTLRPNGEQVYDNHDHTITDNHIHHGGVLVGHGGGVFLNQSGDNLISHNHIHDMPRYGVAIKGLISTEMSGQLPEDYDGPEITWENHFGLLTSHNNVIEFNDIHTVLQDSEDAGAISFKGIGKGTVVDNNHIHDYEVHRGHNKAVYLDDGSSFALVRKNLVHGLTTAGEGKIFTITAKGYGNRVTNNILVAEERDSIGINSAQIKNEPISAHRWDHNIVYAPDHRAVLFNFQVENWFPEWVTAADHNLVHSGTGEYQVTGIPGSDTWENWRTLADGRYGQNSLSADPLFVDPAHDDYHLRPNSPALGLGIEPIDITTVGPRSGRPTVNAPTVGAQ